MSDTSPLKIVSTELPVGPITPRTLVAFLFGSSSAIRQIAGSRAATLLGLAMVLLAGFAREYDQESLLHEPWYLLLPAAASVALSLVLVVMCWRTTDPETLPPLLRCIWFCSPMALLYAFPVERFGDELESAKFNLTCLGIVSLWRVVLAIRIVSVLRGISSIRSTFQVMWAVDTLVLFALFFSPVPIIVVMGGIRLSPAEQLISDVQLTILPIAFYSWPVWMIGYIASCFGGLPTPNDACPNSPVSRGAWMLIAGWFGLAIAGSLWAQPEQFRKHRVERLIFEQQYKLAVDEMCCPRSQFPPLWNPPNQREEYVFPLITEILKHPAPPEWVVECYGRSLPSDYGHRIGRQSFWNACSPEELENKIALMDKFPYLAATLDEPVPDASNSSAIAEFVSEQLNPNIAHPAEQELIPPDLLMRLLKHARRLPEGPQVDELEQQLKAMTKS